MNKNSYILNNPNYVLNHSGICFEYTFGWLLQNWYKADNIDYMDNQAGYGNSIKQEQTFVVDDFLMFSCGYGDCFAINRFDETTKLIVNVYNDLNAAINYGNSLAIDKERKIVWAGEYAGTLITEYDYSGMYYSGDTSPVRTTYSTADGFVSCYIGYGPMGGSLWHDDTNKLLYYVPSDAYRNYVYRWDTENKCAYDQLEIYNNTTYTGIYRSSALIYEEDKDRLMISNNYSNGTPHVVVENISDTGQTRAVCIPAPTWTESHPLTRFMCRSYLNEDDYYMGYSAGRSCVNNIGDLLSNTAITTTSYIRPLAKYDSKRGYKINYYRYGWEDKYRSLNYYYNNQGIRMLGSGYYMTQASGLAYLFKSFGLFPDFKNNKLVGPVEMYFNGWTEDNGNTNTKEYPIVSDLGSFINTDYTKKQYLGVGSNILPIYASDTGSTFYTGKTYHSDVTAGYNRVFDYNGVEPWSMNDGFEIEFGTFNAFNRLSDNLIDYKNPDLQDAEYTYDASTETWTYDGTLAKTLAYIPGWEADTYYELKFNITEFNRTDSASANYWIRFSNGDAVFTDDYTYYGIKRDTIYIKTPSTITANYFYIQCKGTEITFKDIELRKVEKVDIDNVEIENFFDNIYYPHSATTFTLSVSGDDGNSWENWNLNDKCHQLLNPGKDVRVKMETTNLDDRLLSAYIQGNEAPIVNLYSANSNRILRVDNKIVRIGGKIVRI